MSGRPQAGYTALWWLGDTLLRLSSLERCAYVNSVQRLLNTNKGSSIIKFNTILFAWRPRILVEAIYQSFDVFT